MITFELATEYISLHLNLWVDNIQEISASQSLMILQYFQTFFLKPIILGILNDMSNNLIKEYL